MESLDTSMGLTFSLRWVGKKAETEEELSSEDLVKFLERDSKLMKQEDIEKFKKSLGQDELNYIKESIIVKKTVDFLVESSIVK